MRGSTPSRQQGFSLLILVIALAIVAFSLVLGYSSVMARQQFNTLEASQRKFVAESLARVAQAWRGNAYEWDKVGAAMPPSVESVLQASGVQMKYGAKAAVSNVLLDASAGISYRVFVVYLPLQGDGEDIPFDLARFQETGIAASCDAASMEAGTCPPRVFDTYSSQDLEREFLKETRARMSRAALKAQAYFKARMLQHPESAVSVNYFRAPSGECVATELDLGCLDSYMPLYELAGPGTPQPIRMALNLGLGTQEVMSAWGQPIYASNLIDSNTADVPFSMTFKADTPAGSSIKITAVQQL